MAQRIEQLLQFEFRCSTFHWNNSLLFTTQSKDEDKNIFLNKILPLLFEELPKVLQY